MNPSLRAAYSRSATSRCFSSSTRSRATAAEVVEQLQTTASSSSSLPLRRIPKDAKRAQKELLYSLFSPLGSSQSPQSQWKPHHSLHSPPSPSSLTLSALIASGAHLGHAPSLASPAFLPYIYGTRAGLSIIDLEQTLPLLRRAANVTRAVAEADGLVLFVGTGNPDGPLGAAVRKAAKRLGANGYHIDTRWLPGLLTNPYEVLGAQAMRSTNTTPDLVIFLNPLENLKAIRECGIAMVPTIGIIDTNVDPRLVMYPIPANDESVRTAELIAGTLSMAGREGVQNRLEREKEDEDEEFERKEPGMRGERDDSI